MHKASKDVQIAMRKAKIKWNDYYILKMDVTKYFQNIDKSMANEYLNKVIIFLDNNLKLTLNSKTRIFKNIQGVNFCGYKINEKRMKIRNTSKYRMKRKLKKYTKLLNQNKITLPEIHRSIAGWLGYVKHADSNNLMKSMFYIEG